MATRQDSIHWTPLATKCASDHLATSSASAPSTLDATQRASSTTCCWLRYGVYCSHPELLIFDLPAACGAFLHCCDQLRNLLQVVFRDESALISPSNDSNSYVSECKLRGLLPDEDALLEFAEQYSTDNLQQTTQVRSPSLHCQLWAWRTAQPLHAPGCCADAHD